MTTLKFSTAINAPLARCFDLARSIDLHLASTQKTKERVVAGRTKGLVEKGDTITWEAIHFGIKQRLTSSIVDMEPPYLFSDRMIEGAFKSMYHVHGFESKDGLTVMTDDFRYETPFGILGMLFNSIVLKRYMTGFLVERNAMIKSMAEGSAWKEILK